MARFLTDDWIGELDAALRDDLRASRSSEGIRLVVQQVVTGCDGGEIRYALTLDDGAVRVRPGAAPDADVTFTQDRATAIAIARGELSAQSAFLEGRLRVSGDLGKLIDHQAALAHLDDALDRARARTTFPPA